MRTFIDLCKASDIVDHKILLHEIKHYGINENYLPNSNRKQYIQYDKTNKTNCLNTKCGVPQGSSFIPLLFLWYIV